MNAQREAELLGLKAHYPYRIVWGALSPSGEWFATASVTKAKPNRYTRMGWTVYVVQAA